MRKAVLGGFPFASSELHYIRAHRPRASVDELLFLWGASLVTVPLSPLLSIVVPPAGHFLLPSVPPSRRLTSNLGARVRQKPARLRQTSPSMLLHERTLYKEPTPSRSLIRLHPPLRLLTLRMFGPHAHSYARR